MQRGMPRYGMLSRDQLHALYLTIRASAREAQRVRRCVHHGEDDDRRHPGQPLLAHHRRQARARLSGRSQIGLARSMTLKQLQNCSEEFSDPVLAKIDPGLHRRSDNRSRERKPSC